MTIVTIEGIPRDVRPMDIEDFFHGFGRIADVSIRNGYCNVEFEDRRDADDAVHRLDGRRLCGERVDLRIRGGGGGGGGRGGFDDRRGGGGGGYGRDRYDDRRGGYDDRRGGGGYDDRRGGYGGGGDRYGGGRRPKSTVTRTVFAFICKNLSSRVNWMDLKDLARKYGDVTYTEANKQREREGIVTFSNRKDLENAFEQLQGKELCGRPLELEYENEDVLRDDFRGDTNNDHPTSRGGGRGGRDDDRGDSRRERSRSPDNRYNRSRSRSYSR